HDVRAPSRRHRDIGYMPQANALYPELTVRENLRFRCDVFGLAPRSTIAEATAAFGLDRVLDQRVDRLSGGWGRRVQ
ncbi:ATP-binding cassette domain-containing protein, partial [Campylobacter jejuni]